MLRYLWYAQQNSVLSCWQVISKVSTVGTNQPRLEPNISLDSYNKLDNEPQGFTQVLKLTYLFVAWHDSETKQDQEGGAFSIFKWIQDWSHIIG